MKKAAAILPAAILLVSCGCGTIASLSGRDEPKLLGGMRYDLHYMDFDGPALGICGGWLPLVIDFPFCLALDVLFLPVTIPWEIFR